MYIIEVCVCLSYLIEHIGFGKAVFTMFLI